MQNLVQLFWFMPLLYVYSVFMLVSLCSASSVQCDDNRGLDIRVDDSNIPGRYKLKWCEECSGAKAEILIDVDNRNNSTCKDYSLRLARRMNSQTHSRFEKPIEKLLNCSQTCCLSAQLDLIYTGCYTIRAQGGLGPVIPKMIYINNSLTKDYFINSSATARDDFFEGEVYVTIQFGTIPVTAYIVELLNFTNSKTYDLKLKDCMSSSYRVDCYLRNIPKGDYRFTLIHRAPWTNGNLFLAKEAFYWTFSVPDVPVIGNEDKGWGWNVVIWVCAGAALCVCACGAIFISINACRYYDNNYRYKQESLKAVTPSPNTANEPVSGILLLLYARDAPPFMRAMSCLREYLRSNTSFKVMDIWEGVAPDASLVRSTLIHPQTKVLVIESPAASQLYATDVEIREDGPALCEPLMHKRVIYRRPVASDAVLLAAFRLIHELPPPSVDNLPVYRKYYVACVRGVGSVDTVPLVVPHVRYTLPEHLQQLTKALVANKQATIGDRTLGNRTHGDRTLGDRTHGDRTLAEPSRALDNVSTALDTFAQYVTENPDYLIQQLMVIK